MNHHLDRKKSALEIFTQFALLFVVLSVFALVFLLLFQVVPAPPLPPGPTSAPQTSAPQQPEEIAPFTPQPPKNVMPSGHTCPSTSWIDCMPGPGPAKNNCTSEYLQWATENCPGFKGAAY